MSSTQCGLTTARGTVELQLVVPLICGHEQVGVEPRGVQEESVRCHENAGRQRWCDPFDAEPEIFAQGFGFILLPP
jgi:hypothetical protein